MTTRDKGITLPAWDYVRFTAGKFEVSSALDFSSNASYKYTSLGIQPITQVAPVAAAPQDLYVQSQDSNGGFAAIGGAVRLIGGAGSGGNTSGNVTFKDSAGNGGAWNTTHPVLGAYHLWVDALAHLRIKASAPTTDLDGTLVNIADLVGSAVYDPPNLADGAGATTTVTVTGSVLGDFVTGKSFSLDLQGITVTAWVSSANTVSVRFQNESGGALDLASGTIKVRVSKA